MQCFIYKSQKKVELYVYLEKRDDFSAIPPALQQNLGSLTFVMELELSEQRKLARADVIKVMDNLKNKGFFVQMPPSLIPLELAKTDGQLH